MPKHVSDPQVAANQSKAQKSTVLRPRKGRRPERDLT